jgi:hypothetical protein
VRRYVITPEPEAPVAAALAEAFEQLAGEDGWDGAGAERPRRWSEIARGEAVGSEADAAPV